MFLIGTWNQNGGFWDTMYNRVDESTVRTSQSGFLWGSSSVWQPWAPEPPKSPTRTPPGFMPQREPDERLPQSNLYNPFDIGNIWTQQQSSPWDYQQREQ